MKQGLLWGLLGCLVVSSGAAEPLMAVLKDGPLAKELGISDQQREALRFDLLSLEQKSIELRGQMALKELELRILLAEAKPDEARVRSLAQELFKLEAELRFNRVERILSLKRILTEDQLLKLEAWRMKHRPRPRPHRPSSLGLHERGKCGAEACRHQSAE
jgi:Spy/CpxP family protein refolding chaperone